MGDMGNMSGCRGAKEKKGLSIKMLMYLPPTVYEYDPLGGWLGASMTWDEMNTI